MLNILTIANIKKKFEKAKKYQDSNTHIEIDKAISMLTKAGSIKAAKEMAINKFNNAKKLLNESFQKNKDLKGLLELINHLIEK